MPDEEAEIEKIFASRLPSRGSARLDARNEVCLHGISLTHASKVISKATKTTISTKQLAAVLRKKSVPVVNIKYDDPLIYELDAGNIERLKQSGILGKAIDHFQILKGLPELLHGATTGDMFMPPRGIEVLEGIAAYACLKKNRGWSQLKRWYRPRD